MVSKALRTLVTDNLKDALAIFDTCAPEIECSSMDAANELAETINEAGGVASVVSE